MAMKAPTWTATLQTGQPLGVILCPSTGTIKHIFEDGAFDRLNWAALRPTDLSPVTEGRKAAATEVEVGDRIVEVAGKSGNAQDLLSAFLSRGMLGEEDELAEDVSITLLRPLLVQPVVVQMQPGEELGLDVDIANTNVIQTIDSGLVADLNKVYHSSIEVGDKILEVEGMPGNAVEQIRAWVQEHKETPHRDLHLTVARRPELVEGPGVLAAWRFSVMVRVQPGQSLGAIISTDVAAISDIEDGGAISSLNKAHPRALQVGDRILTVDGLPCPRVSSAAELEAWFQTHKPPLLDESSPRDLNLTVLRPGAPADAVATVLPPYEYRLVDVGARLESKPTAEAEDSAGSTASTADIVRQLTPEATHSAKPPTLSTPVPLGTLPESKVVAAPERRWYQIFSGTCCTPSDTDIGEQHLKLAGAGGEQQVSMVNAQAA